jgi:hypothetical protein
MEHYDQNFWNNVNKDYFNYVYAKMLPMRRYLSDFFRIDDNEFFNYAVDFENELYNAVKKDFTKKSRDLPDKAVEFFRKDFWFENGIQRNWNKIKDEDIDNLFKNCRTKYLSLFENLKLFKLLKSPLKCNTYLILDINYDENNVADVIDTIPQLIASHKEDWPIIMRQNEVHYAQDRYNGEISRIVEDAKRRKVIIKFT